MKFHSDEKYWFVHKIHRTVFAAWSILNILAGGFLVISGLAFYFGSMCLVWGLINGVISLWFWQHGQQAEKRKNPAWISAHIRLTLKINLLLDLLYIITGFGMLQFGRSSEMWQHFGWACILQGVFLLLQDGMVLYGYISSE